jgi:hypothetical protein
MGAVHQIFSLSPLVHATDAERLRCQHANLSDLLSRRPTHTFSVKHRKSFSTTRIYASDKANLSLHAISDSEDSTAEPATRAKVHEWRHSAL